MPLGSSGLAESPTAPQLPPCLSSVSQRQNAMAQRWEASLLANQKKAWATTVIKSQNGVLHHSCVPYFDLKKQHVLLQCVSRLQWVCESVTKLHEKIRELLPLVILASQINFIYPVFKKLFYTCCLKEYDCVAIELLKQFVSYIWGTLLGSALQ